MMRPAIIAYECGLVQPIALPAHIAGGHLRQQPDASGLMGRPDIGRDLGAFAKGDTVSDAWMPGPTRVQKVIDGGPPNGGPPPSRRRALSPGPQPRPPRPPCESH